MLASKPVKIQAVYLSACLGGCLPVLMPGDLNAKHVVWNSRLITKRTRDLRDYVDKNSCRIYGPNTPISMPFNTSANPVVLDIAITKGLFSPPYLTACSAPSTDHLIILIDSDVDHPF